MEKNIKISKLSLSNGAVITAMLLFTILSVACFAQDKVIQEKTFNVNQGEKFILETDVGDAVINSWTKNEVFVKVLGNSEALEKLDFEFEKTSAGVFVKAEKKDKSQSSWWKGIKLRYEVNIPKNFDLDISTAGGDIKVNDVDGTGELKTSGGDLVITNFSGNVVAKTSGGDINVKNVSGDNKLSTSGGDIEGSAIQGSVEAKTSGGDINLDVSGGEVIGKTSGGDIVLKFSGNNEGIDLATSGGDISLAVPSDLKGNLDLKTSGGDIDCDIDLTNKVKKSSHKLSGEINGGGKDIICKTTGGDIKIHSKM